MKPFIARLEYDEIFEDNYELHRINSFEMQEKLKEQKQKNIDEELYGNLSFHNYDSLKRKEFYDNVRKNHEKILNDELMLKMDELEHNINVKNILIDCELYEGNLT